MLTFNRIEMKEVFRGHRVTVYEDILETPSGEIVHYDYVHNRSGAGILLVDDENQVVLIKQYRTTLDAVSIEIPAGCQESPEEPLDVCALREAEEETGLIPKKLYLVSHMIGAVGLLDERTAIYIGTDLDLGKQNFDDNEFIDVIKMSVEDAVEAIYKQEIVDSKTIIAILAYRDLHIRGRV